MGDIFETGLLPSRVTPVFEGNLLSFMLLGGTKFEDLADRLDRFGHRNSSRVIAIKVKFSPPPEVWPRTI